MRESIKLALVPLRQFRAHHVIREHIKQGPELQPHYHAFCAMQDRISQGREFNFQLVALIAMQELIKLDLVHIVLFFVLCVILEHMKRVLVPHRLPIAHCVSPGLISLALAFHRR